MISSVLQTRLRMLRGSVPQATFARNLTVKQTSYSSWESGAKSPSADIIYVIATKTGVSADWLLGISDDENAPVGVHRIPEELQQKDEIIARLQEELKQLKCEMKGLKYALNAVGRERRGEA